MNLNEEQMELMSALVEDLWKHVTEKNNMSRFCNALITHKIYFVIQLYALGELKLSKLSGLGPTARQVIKSALTAMQLPNLPKARDPSLECFLNVEDRHKIKTLLDNVFKQGTCDPVNAFIRAALPPTQATALSAEFLKKIAGSPEMQSAIRNVVNEQLSL